MTIANGSASKGTATRLAASRLAIEGFVACFNLPLHVRVASMRLISSLAKVSGEQIGLSPSLFLGRPGDVGAIAAYLAPSALCSPPICNSVLNVRASIAKQPGESGSCSPMDQTRRRGPLLGPPQTFPQ